MQTNSHNARRALRDAAQSLRAAAEALRAAADYHSWWDMPPRAYEERERAALAAAERAERAAAAVEQQLTAARER